MRILRQITVRAAITRTVNTDIVNNSHWQSEIVMLRELRSSRLLGHDVCIILRLDICHANYISLHILLNEANLTVTCFTVSCVKSYPLGKKLLSEPSDAVQIAWLSSQVEQQALRADNAELRSKKSSLKRAEAIRP